MSTVRLSVLVCVLFSLVGAVRAETLYQNNSLVSKTANLGQWVLLKKSGNFVAKSDRISVQLSAWENNPNSGGNYLLSAELIDLSTGKLVAQATRPTNGTATTPETNLWAYMAVVPGKRYRLDLYAKGLSSFVTYRCYDRIFKIENGYVPFGIRFP